MFSGQIIKEKKLLKGVIEEKLDNKVSSIGGKEFNKKLSEKFGSDDEEEKFVDADKDNKDVKDEPKSGKSSYHNPVINGQGLENLRKILTLNSSWMGSS